MWVFYRLFHRGLKFGNKAPGKRRVLLGTSLAAAAQQMAKLANCNPESRRPLKAVRICHIKCGTHDTVLSTSIHRIEDCATLRFEDACAGPGYVKLHLIA